MLCYFVCRPFSFPFSTGVLLPTKESADGFGRFRPAMLLPLSEIAGVLEEGRRVAFSRNPFDTPLIFFLLS